MARMPQLSGPEVVRRLERLGFVQDHCKGSHVVMVNSTTNRMTVVPVHGSKPLKKGTLKAILRQAGVTLEQLLDTVGGREEGSKDNPAWRLRPHGFRHRSKFADAFRG